MKAYGNAWLAVLVVLSGAGCGQGDEGDQRRPGGQGDQSVAEVAAAVRGVSDDEIVLGVHTDLSGPTAIWGVGATNAARMRFDAVNTAGGIHGRQIRYVVEDAQYQVPRAIQAANKLINRDKVLAMVLAVGTPMNNAIMPQQFEQGVPNLFPITGARSMVEPPHPLKFTQRGIYYHEVRAAIRYFVEEQGKKVVCAIYQDTDYGQEILEGVEDQLAAMGLTLAAQSAHKPTASEFTAAILRLMGAQCDLVLMGTVHRDTILVLASARKMGWKDVAWVGNNAAYAQVIADSPTCEGYYAFVHMAKIYADDEKSPEVQAWWDEYVERYGQEPDLPAMEGYRGADLVVMALEKAGRDLTVQGLVTALEGITSYQDIFGYTVSFSPEKHSGATESSLSQVRNGRWVTLRQSVSY
ncbi:MAG: ABC transporter substrate-binding protein [Gammaproteobacteria bacterium]|nr:ABC transporter substrate-binding protein [Gammaproteobacteria bacterium]